MTDTGRGVAIEGRGTADAEAEMMGAATAEHEWLSEVCDALKSADLPAAKAWVETYLKGISPDDYRAAPAGTESASELRWGLDAPAWRRRLNGQGPEAELQFFGLTDPMKLLPALGISGEGKDATVDIARYTKRLFDSPMISAAQEEPGLPWALVLDLRLFSGARSRANTWHLTLAKAAKTLHEHAAELAWPAFEYDLEELQAWLNLQSEKSPDAAGAQAFALSLLPRLCALRWPSVPILIFSSSQRRDILEKLAPYKNIFLAGAKPNLMTGRTSDSLASFGRRWLSAMGDAERLLQVQSRLRALKCHSLPGPTNQSHHRHIAIAIDESGNFSSDTNSALIAAVALADGDNESQATGNFTTFMEHLRQIGVAFVRVPPFYPETFSMGKHLPPNAVIKVKGDLRGERSACGAVLQASVTRPHSDFVSLGICRYQIPKARYLNEKGYLAEAAAGSSAAESTYLQGLSNFLELILSEYLPSLLNSDQKFTLSIYLPSKQTAHTDEQTAKTSACRFDRLFVGGKYELVETLGGYGVAPVLLGRAIETRHNRSDVMASVRVINTRKIAYDGDVKDPDSSKGKVRNFYCFRCEKSFFNRQGKSYRENCEELGEYIYQPDSNKKRWKDGFCITEAIKAAEYSVLAHIADLFSGLRPKLLSHRNLDLNKWGGVSFDCILNDTLQDFLSVGRMLDAGEINAGFGLAFRHDFFVKGVHLEGGAKAPVHRRLLLELQRISTSSKGGALVNLGAKPTQR